MRLRPPEPETSGSFWGWLAVPIGLAVTCAALWAAWPQHVKPKVAQTTQVTTVDTAPESRPTVSPVLASQNPWDDPNRPTVRPVRKATPTPEAVVEPPPPPKRPTPRIARPATPRVPVAAPAYPVAAPKPTPPPLDPLPPWPNGAPDMTPETDPDDPNGMPTTEPPGGAPLPSTTLQARVVQGVVTTLDQYKVYSVRLHMDNSSAQPVGAIRVALKRDSEVYYANGSGTIAPRQGLDVDLTFNGVPKNFHPRQMEIGFSTPVGDFVTQKSVSDGGWKKGGPAVLPRGSRRQVPPIPPWNEQDQE